METHLLLNTDTREPGVQYSSVLSLSLFSCVLLGEKENYNSRSIINPKKLKPCRDHRPKCATYTIKIVCDLTQSNTKIVELRALVDRGQQPKQHGEWSLPASHRTLDFPVRERLRRYGKVYPKMV